MSSESSSARKSNSVNQIHDGFYPSNENTPLQIQLLAAMKGLKGEKPSGQELKSRIVGTTLPQLNHGRLYPNLDDLVEDGYVAKGELDGRTNYYEITEDGEEALVTYIENMATMMGVDTSDLLDNLGLDIDE